MLRAWGIAVAVVVTCAFVVGGGVAAATFGRDSPAWTTLLVTAASVLLALGPVLLFGVVSFWDVRRSPAAERLHRRYRLAAIVATLVEAVLYAVWGAATGAPWWVATLFIAGAFACLGAVIAATPALQRAVPRVPDTGTLSWAEVPGAELRRVGRAAGVSSGIALVAAAAAGVAAAALWPGVVNAGVVVPAVVFATLWAAAVPGFAGTFRLNRRLRDAAGGDVDLPRRFSRVVFKGRDERLDESQQTMAARWAAVVWAQYVLVLVTQVPVWVSILVPQILRLTRGDRDPNIGSVIIVGAATLGIAVFVPLTVRNARRARRYAREHADLLTGAPVEVTG